MNSYQIYSDEQLLELLKKNDEAAFKQIYLRYWKRLFVVGVNKIGDHQLVEEIVQDIFTDIWKRRLEIDFQTKLMSYLAAAMKYKVIDARLKRQRIKNQEFKLSTLSKTENGAEEHIRFNELRALLQKLVADLPEKCQIIYQLSREEGYSHKQIAAHLKISEKTVEYHLGNALRSLKTRLKFISLFFFSNF